MYMRRMRFDLFICFFLTLLIGYGIITIGEKAGFAEWLGSAASKAVNSHIQEVPDGEVGGYATKDTPRVQTLEDLQLAAEKNQVFTVETNAVKYYNMGTFEGDNYEWRILELDDGSCFAVRLNTSRIAEAEDSFETILPVGKLVLSPPEALEEMKAAMEKMDGTFYIDAYIDMDGEANTTYISPSMENFMVFNSFLLTLAPVIVVALIILGTFGIHRIFVKLNIFPPVFAGRKW